VRATALATAPAQAFRALGLVRRRLGDTPGAVSAFEHYLARAPQAGDASLIQTYLSQLKP